jgi:hypothetical protein
MERVGVNQMEIPRALIYSFRVGYSGLPLDDEVLYGKIGPFGHLVHISEIEGY